MKDKISIVVPTYNVYNYLRKCLDSLVLQDYPNFDILVINDGSPFHEDEIIKEYELKYPNLIKGINKENGGYGSVLELAFKESDAKYIVICDPDDYLVPNALSELIKTQELTNADLVVGAKYLIYGDESTKEYNKSYNDEFGIIKANTLYKKDDKEFNTFYFFEPSPHAKLYKRELVKNIKFPHKVSYTDNLLYFYTLTNIESIAYSDLPLAYYLINREGNTATDVKPKVIDAIVTVFNSILDQAKPSDIFYFRMFEAFLVNYYRIDGISADKKTIDEKYNLLFTFLQRLIPYHKAILSKSKEYNNLNDKMYNQRVDLLDEKKSYKTYKMMIFKRRLKKVFKK